MTINPYEPEFLAALHAEIKSLEKDTESIATIGIRPITAFAIITQIQIASQHSDVDDWICEWAEDTATELQEMFKHDSAIYQFLQLGWHCVAENLAIPTSRIRVITNDPMPPDFKDLDVEVVAIDDLPPELQEKVQYIHDQVFGRITEELEGMGDEAWVIEDEEDETDS